jgi:hypothetical protein
MDTERTATEARLQETWSRLRLDAALVDAMDRFAHDGVGALALKGSALAQWLYATGAPRSYVDCDLLVDPAHLERAEQALEALGYDRDFDDREMPSWWREHAGEWVRRSDAVTIDLHRTLPGVRVEHERAWLLLAANRGTVKILEREVPALNLPGRALHVALHAAQHGEGWSKPLHDLTRAIEQADAAIWRRAAELAAGLDATEAFAAGLRLIPAGAELADRLGLSKTNSVDTRLKAASAPPEALTLERLARAGPAAKAAITWRKLFPPPEYVRKWEPRGTDTRRGLARAYLRRPVWVLQRLPDAFRAWWAARRGR